MNSILKKSSNIRNMAAAYMMKNRRTAFSLSSKNRRESGWNVFVEDGRDLETRYDDIRRRYFFDQIFLDDRMRYRMRYPGTITLAARVHGLNAKLKLAIESGMVNENLGIDLVATCVNDIVTTGAVPNCFLDYFSAAALEYDCGLKVMNGMNTACCQCNMKYLYELELDIKQLPGSNLGGRVELSGIVFGYVRKDSVIDGKNIEIGDVLIGLPSSGLHSYGFSLVKRVLGQSGSSLTDNLPGTNITLGESLMSPTAIYVKQVHDIIERGNVKGITQIKYGGLSSAFPVGLGAVIYNDSWTVPPIFKWIQEAGKIEEVEMRRTFNMGIGMVLVVSKESASKILEETSGVYCIGEVVCGHGLIYR